jgi:hypothetical protein
MPWTVRVWFYANAMGLAVNRRGFSADSSYLLGFDAFRRWVWWEWGLKTGVVGRYAERLISA